MCACCWLLLTYFRCQPLQGSIHQGSTGERSSLQRSEGGGGQDGVSGIHTGEQRVDKGRRLAHLLGVSSEVFHDQASITSACCGERYAGFPAAFWAFITYHHLHQLHITIANPTNIDLSRPKWTSHNTPITLIIITALPWKATGVGGKLSR